MRTANNPYPDCAAAYAASYRLSEKILDAYCAATGISRRSIWETDSKAGTNWSAVPTTILEMGFMSNREDDLRMEEDGFAKQAAKGVADGLDAFFDSCNSRGFPAGVQTVIIPAFICLWFL